MGMTMTVLAVMTMSVAMLMFVFMIMIMRSVIEGIVFLWDCRDEVRAVSGPCHTKGV